MHPIEHILELLREDKHGALTIALTAAATLLGGVLLFCCTTIASKLILEPYLAYRALLGEITYKIAVEHAFIVSAPGDYNPEKHLQVADEVRKLAAKLKATAAACPCRWLLRLAHMIPSKQVLNEATGFLYRISNCLKDPNKKHELIFEDLTKVAKLLRIEITQY